MRLHQLYIFENSLIYFYNSITILYNHHDESFRNTRILTSLELGRKLFKDFVFPVGKDKEWKINVFYIWVYMKMIKVKISR